MPRDKQFNVDEALTQAMHAFWAHGYEATSMQELVDCMGINRGSIYATFGDKHALFIQALRHYDRHHREQWLSALAAANEPKAAVLAAFDGAIEATLAQKNSDGCFLVNVALELSPHDGQVAEIVAAGLCETEDFFRRMITAGQQSGSIRVDIDAASTASALLGLFTGLRVLSRSRPEKPLLTALADQAAAMLA
jgi:TetR/AcrR family transcriptional repressor of nem operon